ncbi:MULTISPECIES: outer membrane beta-barrel protein [unclassified Mesorhizobium]|uniref:outer membrane beta-barrel protein n=2 Tax=Mesorhizobium TaxID=68287 RepID=UPI000FC99DE9|nr:MULTISPECIES: outer membrane beta-barrel protein [unclassified Mesorhizobium]TGP23748.1 hypothetical protein EN874_014535 [Mesorhizobium sp. M1D.F.Ca.ET.231.01.1.1]TGP33892.1 hypothetical protein EN877_14540 [Mesorhizobium sp. M1D.F.Ca.ET.234.01.1.1]TGS47257.1 hypothetical protein EN827_14535 [Mesorhizobium sp. M1D.F.Ca.ET.184.01.1.1]TGS62516.1 hypothetical protein EN826_014535 [Mesorhizobium sp. M1D.F.Ca.ET.183.01.1.1]
MSGGEPDTKTGRKGIAVAALLLTASTFAVLRPAPVLAQEADLRGEVSESAILADQQRKARQLRQGSPDQAVPATQAAGDETLANPYQPESPGAVADDDQAATDSIFDQPEATADPFADNQTAAKPRRPSTARQRATDAATGTNAKSDAKTADKKKARKKPGQTTESTARTAATGDQADAAAASDEDTANGRAVTIDSVDRQKLDPGAERTGSIEGQKIKPEDDPFAAPGIKVGTFVFRPTLEQGFTATSNADASSGGTSAVLSETALRFSATSDWRENSALINGYGIFRNTLSGQKINDAQGRIEGRLNVDLDNELRAIAKLGYEAVPESASSPDAIAGVTSQPLRQTVDGSLGVEKDVGKMRYTLTGAVTHDFYGDAELSDGTVLSQKDRDSTLYSATLRTGYQVSPAITPFAEVEAGRRVYDLRLDSNGFERSSTRLGARAGLEFDMRDKLSGEFSVGWLREAIDDDRLPANAGPYVNADLKWSPERGTIVGLTGRTTIEATTAANESGDVLYSGRLTGERQIRANLTANSALGLDWRDYTGSDGHDLILSAEAGLTWWLNRYAGLTTRVRTEKLTSNLPGRDYVANSVYLGLKVQR